MILDLRMPELDGWGVWDYIRKERLQVLVLIISMYDSPSYILHSLNEGAHGFLSKNSEPDEVMHAITLLIENGFYLNAQVSKILAKQAINSSEIFSKTNGVYFDQREKLVLYLVCKELNNQQIADRIGYIGMRRVETIKSEMIKKVGAKGMFGVLIYALKENIIDLRNLESM